MRSAPNQPEAELALLAASFQNTETMLDLSSTLKFEHFYIPVHSSIWDALHTALNEYGTADITTVKAVLRSQNALRPAEKALEALEAHPTVVDTSGPLQAVREAYKLRRVYTTALGIANDALDYPADAQKFVEDSESRMFAVNEGTLSESLLGADEISPDAVDYLERLATLGTKLIGTPTGFVDIDEMTNGLQPGNITVLGARPGQGKALSLDTPLPTPTGWTTIGNVTVGDYLFDETGNICRVTAKSEVMHNHDVYNVVFDDGTTVLADADHRWLTYDHRAWKSYRSRGLYAHKGGPYSVSQETRWIHPEVVTTKQIASTLRHTDGRLNHRVLVAEGLELPEMQLPIDPYFLGAWLGDGTSAAPSITSADPEVIERLAGAGFRVSSTTHIEGNKANTYYLQFADGSSIVPVLRELGVLNNKHIPAMYMRASKKQRLELLKGLMDTDGTVNGKGTGHVSITQVSKRLLEQIRELLCSLGHRPNQLRYKSTSQPHGAYTLNWTPPEDVFHLQRKSKALVLADRRGGAVNKRRTIVSCELVPSIPVQCIAVDSPSRLFLATESFIPTHNTTLALDMCLSAARAGHNALFFSLEMSQLELSMNAFSSMAMVDRSRFRNGRLRPEEWKRLGKAVEEFPDLPFWIDDGNCSVSEIEAKARRFKARHKSIGLLVIDYLQIMADIDHNNAAQSISKISRRLKMLAKELECPILLLSQLNRNVESRQDRRPNLSDLRDSGAIEADATMVWFLYRDSYYNPSNLDKRGIAEIIVAKNRFGPTGTYEVTFVEGLPLFANLDVLI